MPEGPAIAYKWKPIEDLPADIENLDDPELEGLRRTWEKERAKLIDSPALADFNIRLTREWSIETGIIEGTYTLDRGTTQTLLDRGISSSYIAHDATNRDPELVSRIIHTHAEVLDGLFAFVKQERQVSTSYIKEIHAALLQYEDKTVVFDSLGNKFETTLIKGDYKRANNSPLKPDGRIHEYCPWEHVASEMDRLIEFHRSHFATSVPPAVEAAWLHHRFTQIHPFQDGNGRVARAIASLVLIRAGLYPLVIHRDARTSYIDCLEDADNSDLRPLCRLFATNQKRLLSQALGLLADIKPVATAEEALHVAHEYLIDVGRVVRPEYLRAQNIANQIEHRTLEKLNYLAQIFAANITRTQSSFTSGVKRMQLKGELSADDIRSIARMLAYEPNLTMRDNAWGLTLSTPGNPATIIISVQGIGPRFEGVLAAVAYYRQDSQVSSLSSGPFEIRYDDDPAKASASFALWLEECLKEGITRWRHSLV